MRDFTDTIPTDHAPLEGEPRRPLYPRRSKPRSTGCRMVVAVLLVAICAVLALVVAPGSAQ